jgi:hypothetical protein
VNQIEPLDRLWLHGGLIRHRVSHWRLADSVTDNRQG